MNVIITGALGHIGSKLIRMLPGYCNIYAIDNLSTNRYCSLFNLNRDINFSEGHFLSIPHSALKSADVIIHLAAVTDAANSFDNKDIEKININETKRFIDVCRMESKAKFIFPSSTSVYGTSQKVVTEEDINALNPQSPYASAKLEIERYLRAAWRELRPTILRCGTIFGVSPGIRFHTAINKFCYQAAINQPLTIWQQNYDQFRPYLGIKDCCRAIYLAMIDNNTDDKTFNAVTNNYILKDITDYIATIKPIKLNMVNTPLLNQYSYQVSVKKFRGYGFLPKDDLFREIKKTIGLFE